PALSTSYRVVAHEIEAPPSNSLGNRGTPRIGARVVGSTHKNYSGKLGRSPAHALLRGKSETR
ncbi:MAG: hypothetical protein J6R96_09615, partial [Spirochaetaceae bacterium]|nr:hypothetical protein [Spirochaetaceae bacterium]